MAKSGAQGRYNIKSRDNAATRLPACDRHHPNEPSELTEIRNPFTGNLEKRECRVCKRVRHKVRTASKGYTPGPYGVVRLTWVPPEVYFAAISASQEEAA